MGVLGKPSPSLPPLAAAHREFFCNVNANELAHSHQSLPRFASSSEEFAEAFP